MHAPDTSWTASAHLRAIGWGLRARLVEIRLKQLIAALDAHYNPSQPRVPAGSGRESGRWTDRNEGSSLELAGGFTPDQLGLTVQSFVSTFCRGSINSELPGQFYDMTIAEVQARAKAGDAAARTCLKLLGRDDYRK